ncbi:hypothetical protein ABZX51_007868 [Aspergillus tubingensis]
MSHPAVVGFFRGNKESIFKVIGVIKPLVSMDRTEFAIVNRMRWLDGLERDEGGGSSIVRDVGGLATVHNWRERAQEIYDKMQEIKGKYKSCQGSGWWVVAFNPRAYLDGRKLIKLEGEFEALEREIKSYC